MKTFVFKVLQKVLRQYIIYTCLDAAGFANVLAGLRGLVTA